MQFTQFYKIATRQEIDAENAIVKGVSVITTGEAIGHGLMIDSRTLQQVAELGGKFQDGLKVRFNHPGKNGASVLSNAGTLKNFRADGDKVRADLHLLKTSSDTAQILEMAEKMPQSFGLSIVFSGENEEKDGKTFARCTEIYACDLVDDPAANPTGLFSKPINENKSMLETIKTMLGFAPTATEAEIVTSLEKKQKDAAEAAQKTALSAALAEALKPLTEKIASLESKDAANVALAKKAEIESIIAEASKEGKVIPLSTEKLFEVKDGVTTIKMEPATLREMVQNLPKAQVQLQRKTTVAQSKDGAKKFEKGTREHAEFYAERRKENIAALNEQFANIN